MFLSLTAPMSHTDTVAKRTHLVAYKSIGQILLMEDELYRMLNIGQIESSKTGRNSPTVLVKKKDGITRFCVDHRRFNMATVKGAYLLPKNYEHLEFLLEATYVFTLNLSSGYWQIVKGCKKKKTMLSNTHIRFYQWLVMPFELTNTPASFEHLME